MNRVRIAAQDLVARGFLLSEDAAVIVQQAASTNLFAPRPPMTRRVEDMSTLVMAGLDPAIHVFLSSCT